MHLLVALLGGVRLFRDYGTVSLRAISLTLQDPIPLDFQVLDPATIRLGENDRPLQTQPGDAAGSFVNQLSLARIAS
jgi:hypothetical protein